MPNKNSTIPLQGTSIHLFGNGFSFCTPSKTEFIPAPKGSEDFKSAIDEITNFYPKETIQNLQVVSYHRPSTFVPAVFFEEKLLPNYLRFAGEQDKGSISKFDVLENENTINVYAIPKDISELLNSSLKNNFLCHYNTLLYKEVVALSKSVGKNKFQLFIHLQSGGMDLYLTENTNMVFQNFFYLKNEEEFLYYVFFVVEQYQLKPQEFEIVFLGEIKNFNSYYEALKKYHLEVHFAKSHPEVSLKTDHHPAPYIVQTSF
jgi:hypothetical protein